MALLDVTALKIVPSPEIELPWTVAQVFSRLASDVEQRQWTDTLAQIRSGELSADGFLQARYRDKPVGAIWVQLQPGQLASIWPPQSIDEAAEHANEISQRLLKAVDEVARRGGARIIQSLLETDAGPDAERLMRAGYKHVADLLYLVSSAAAFPTSQPESDLQFVPFTSSERPRLATIIEQTYEHTRDCPALNDARPIANVLEGYEAVGDRGQQHWLIARAGEQDVGCLLLTNHPQHKICEIVYMGIIPAARGRGFGLSLTRHAQWIASQSRAERLVLAVDAANSPAIKSYAAAGFTAWDRRSVFVKRLG